jgi:hypothetical protein
MATRLRLRVMYDGEVLRPEQPLDLPANTTYLVTIEPEAGDERDDGEATYPLTQIRRLATDMGVTDLSTRHGEYAHGRIVDGEHGA